MHYGKSPRYKYIMCKDLRFHPDLLKLKDELVVFQNLSRKFEYIKSDYIDHILHNHPITVIENNGLYFIVTGLITYQIVRSRVFDDDHILCSIIAKEDKNFIENKISCEILCDKLFYYVKKVNQIGTLYLKIMENNSLFEAVKRCINIKGKTHLSKFLGANYNTLFPRDKKNGRS